MKTVVKSVLLGLSLFAAFCALLVVSASAVKARPIGSDKKMITAVNHVAYASRAGRVISVNVEKPADEAVRVEFRNQQGQLMAEQFVGKQAGTYAVKFNVEQLPDGFYQVNVISKNSVGKHSFTLRTPEKSDASRTLSID